MEQLFYGKRRPDTPGDEFDFELHGDPAAGKSETERMKKTLKDIDLDDPLDYHIRTYHERYELLARRAYAEGHRSVQRVIDERCFPTKSVRFKNWRKELKEMRAIQRAAGIKDETFFHSTILKKLGHDVKPGRRRIPTKRAA